MAVIDLSLTPLLLLKGIVKVLTIFELSNCRSEWSRGPRAEATSHQGDAAQLCKGHCAAGQQSPVFKGKSRSPATKCFTYSRLSCNSQLGYATSASLHEQVETCHCNPGFVGCTDLVHLLCPGPPNGQGSLRCNRHNGVCDS